MWKSKSFEKFQDILKKSNKIKHFEKFRENQKNKKMWKISIKIQKKIENFPENPEKIWKISKKNLENFREIL